MLIISEYIILVTSGNEPDIKKTIGGQKNRNWGLITKHSVGISALTNKQPRIRFLLADDPGAGKTIMAGLLIKELKIRGLVKRILIITPANLTFQWQRELKDKFREEFEVVRGDVLRANYGSNPWQEKNQVITSVSWIPFNDELTPKEEECIVSPSRGKDKAYFERQMGKAMAEGCHILSPEGIGVIVFAHKSTSGWEAQLQAMVDAGWTITGSWPIDTELNNNI
ncbi:SNF2-related protein [Aphanizomenon sp. UHCC 0183]|uniref:SNF2-related protein n=1 Tax=Aphanizomenon sp. UHCC 0183 TaxID=2590028 RepID=UPI00352A7876